MIQLYLQQPLAADGTQGLRYPIAEDVPRAQRQNRAKWAITLARCDGGLSLNAEPPPDGKGH